MPPFGMPVSPAGQDDAADALTLVEMLGAVRNVSDVATKKKSEEVAKRPQPVTTVTYIDGKPHVTVKDMPVESPVKEVRKAGTDPFVGWMDSLLKKLPEIGNSLPDPAGSDIDEGLRTPEGRKNLAKELGLEDPADVSGYFLQHGLVGYRRARGDYERKINNPANLGQAIRAKRLAAQLDIVKQGTGILNELQDVDSRGRAENRADRQDDAFLRQTVLGPHMEEVYGRQQSPAAAIALAKNIAGERWNDSYADVITALYAGGLTKQVEGRKKAARDEEDQKLQREAADRAAAAAERAERQLGLSFQREDRLERQSDKKKGRVFSTSRSNLRNRSGEDLTRELENARRGTGTYSEDSVLEAMDVAESAWNDEFEQNVLTARGLRAKIAAAHLRDWTPAERSAYESAGKWPKNPGSINPVNKTDVAQWRNQADKLAQRNLRLKRDLNWLAAYNAGRTAADADVPPPAPPAKPAPDPMGIRH